MLVLRIVSQNITKSLDSFGSGRNPLASVNHNVPRSPTNAWENLSSAEQKARLAELTRVRVARHRQNKKEKEKAKESVIINSNVTRAASIEETIQPFAAVLENTEHSAHQEDIREAPNEMTPVKTSISHSKNRCYLFQCNSSHEGPRSSTQAFQSTEQEFTDISEKSQCGEKTKPFATENFRSWCHSFRLSPIHFAVPLKLDDQVRVSEEFTESEEFTDVPEVTSVKDSSVSTAAMTEEDCTEPPHVRLQLRSVNSYSESRSSQTSKKPSATVPPGS
jgi:hypothetical protein